MHERAVVKYVCDYCGKEFDVKFWCEQHEEEMHKCNLCKHSYYVYCTELACSLKDNGKECMFEPRKDNK